MLAVCFMSVTRLHRTPGILMCKALSFTLWLFYSGETAEVECQGFRCWTLQEGCVGVRSQWDDGPGRLIVHLTVWKSIIFFPEHESVPPDDVVLITYRGQSNWCFSVVTWRQDSCRALYDTNHSWNLQYYTYACPDCTHERIHIGVFCFLPGPMLFDFSGLKLYTILYS